MLKCEAKALMSKRHLHNAVKYITCTIFESCSFSRYFGTFWRFFDAWRVRNEAYINVKLLCLVSGIEVLGLVEHQCYDYILSLLSLHFNVTLLCQVFLFT